MDFNDPREDELLKQAIQDRLVRMGTVFPAEIVSYAAAATPPRAVIQPAFKFRRKTGELQDPPQIHDVPVFHLVGARGGLTVPVAAGDMCLAVVSQRRLDRWLELGGGVVDPYEGADAAPELFNINDAIAFHGLAFEQADADHVVLAADGDAKVKLGGAAASHPVAHGDTVDANFSAAGTWATQVELFLTSVATALGITYPPPVPPGTPAPYATNSTESGKVDAE